MEIIFTNEEAEYLLKQIKKQVSSQEKNVDRVIPYKIQLKLGLIGN